VQRNEVIEYLCQVTSGLNQHWY